MTDMRHSSTGPTQIKVEYATSPRLLPMRRLAWLTLLVAVFAATSIAFWLLAASYTAHLWAGLKPGMTRTQVDRQLWAFRHHPYPGYSGIGPGAFVVRYELLGMGKSTTIQVIYDPSGTVVDAQPVFDN